VDITRYNLHLGDIISECPRLVTGLALSGPTFLESRNALEMLNLGCYRGVL
jgi:hypothetical protein